MTAEVIAWLRSAEGEGWSMDRTRWQPTSAAPSLHQAGAGDPAEDPCGRPPLSPGEDALRERAG